MLLQKSLRSSKQKKFEIFRRKEKKRNGKKEGCSALYRQKREANSYDQQSR